MTEQRAISLTHTFWLAVAGAMLSVIGFLAGAPTAIAAGNLLCWLGLFATLLLYIHSLS